MRVSPCVPRNLSVAVVSLGGEGRSRRERTESRSASSQSRWTTGQPFSPSARVSGDLPLCTARKQTVSLPLPLRQSMCVPIEWRDCFRVDRADVRPTNANDATVLLVDLHDLRQQVGVDGAHGEPGRETQSNKQRARHMGTRAEEERVRDPGDQSSEADGRSRELWTSGQGLKGRARGELVHVDERSKEQGPGSNWLASSQSSPFDAVADLKRPAA